jgi:hypothetical protein
VTTDRTPYCTKIRYGVSGAPEIPIDVPTAPDITLAPTLVEIRYLAPRGEQPAFVDATVSGYWMRGGERVQPEKELLHHFKNGPDGWPGWLAEEARLHDPAVPAPAADRAALSAKLWEIAEHHIVAEWICCEPLDPKHDLCAKGYAVLSMVKTLVVDSPEAWNLNAPLLDAVLAVLPAPTDRATVLREAADAITEVIEADRAYSPRRSNDRAALGGAREIVLNLIDKPRRMADEAQQPETQALFCVCGASAQRDGDRWTHQPGTGDTCLYRPDARPRCPACRVPHDLTPGGMAMRACASILASIADRDAAAQQPKEARP